MPFHGQKKAKKTNAAVKIFRAAHILWAAGRPGNNSISCARKRYILYPSRRYANRCSSQAIKFLIEFLIEVILLKLTKLEESGRIKNVKLGKNERKTFAKIDEVLEMPNLIDLQKSSYEWFIKEGLKEVFRDVSPITDYAGNLILEFSD